MTEIYKTPKHLHIQECDSDGNIRTVKYYREDIINDFVVRTARDLQRIQDEADEPQTDNGIGCSRCEGRYDCYDRDMPNAVLCNNYGKVTDEPQTERSSE